MPRRWRPARGGLPSGWCACGWLASRSFPAEVGVPWPHHRMYAGEHATSEGPAEFRREPVLRGAFRPPGRGLSYFEWITMLPPAIAVVGVPVSLAPISL